jgi:hypothetical protein
VEAGNEREALLRIADRLCAALGCADGGEPLPEAGPPIGGQRHGRSVGGLAPGDERLVLGIRRRLERVAAAVSAGGEPRSPDRAVAAALDGAELVMRGELVCGRRARLATLMPSFVFLVTLPIVEQDEAIELSRRTSALIEEERPEQDSNLRPTP